jgi:hypothetical protein
VVDEIVEALEAMGSPMKEAPGRLDVLLLRCIARAEAVRKEFASQAEGTQGSGRRREITELQRESWGSEMRRSTHLMPKFVAAMDEATEAAKVLATTAEE